MSIFTNKNSLFLSVFARIMILTLSPYNVCSNYVLGSLRVWRSSRITIACKLLSLLQFITFNIVILINSVTTQFDVLRQRWACRWTGFSSRDSSSRFVWQLVRRDSRRNTRDISRVDIRKILRSCEVLASSKQAPGWNEQLGSTLLKFPTHTPLLGPVF